MIERYLAYRNHNGSVLGTLVQTGKNEFKITFRMNESLPAISNVLFTGNKEMSTTKLQNAINDVAYGQPFTRDGFKLLLDNQVKPLYDAIGMIRVNFSDFTLEPDPRVKGVAVHVTVTEGGVYRLDRSASRAPTATTLTSPKSKPATSSTSTKSRTAWTA